MVMDEKTLLSCRIKRVYTISLVWLIGIILIAAWVGFTALLLNRIVALKVDGGVVLGCMLTMLIDVSIIACAMCELKELNDKSKLTKKTMWIDGLAIVITSALITPLVLVPVMIAAPGIPVLIAVVALIIGFGWIAIWSICEIEKGLIKLREKVPQPGAA
jgi:hypothetical protein